MENVYVYCLSIFYLMTLIITYVYNKRENKGILNRKKFLKIALVSPIFILIAFGIGILLGDSNFKYILVIGGGSLIWLYLSFKPDAFKQYEPIATKYFGLMMAVMLAFLIAGCSTTPTPTPKQDSTEIDQQTKDKMMKRFEPPTETEKGRGSGVIR